MQISEQQNTSASKNIPLDMEKWFRVVQGWDATKENQKEYCQRLGISMNTFSYVRGKLLKRNKMKTKFIPMTLTAPSQQKPNDSPTLLLENPRGLKLHISLNLSLEQLSKIMKLSGW